jgi:hypothetical protein
VTLVCPSCGRAHLAAERFCHECGLPLVEEGGPVEAQVTERQARARKIKPQLSEGDLVTVAVGRSQPEAELIQNLLLEEGVPSTLKRSRGFDVPEMLAAGPRDVLVPQSGAETAREVLLQADLADRPSSGGLVPPGRVLAFLLGGVAVVAALVVLIDLAGR